MREQVVMFILFDSNIWLSAFALKSTTGAAVRYYVRQQGATVAIPEVVRLEVERHLRHDLHKRADDIRRSHRELLTVFGSLKEVVLPTSAEIDAKVDETMSKLDVPTIELPFSLEAARSSFLKTIDKVPPSHKSQQFKDGVIWAHCIDLLSRGDVYLVTDDRAFYEEGNPSKGLAATLRDEAAAISPGKLTAFHNLAALLVEIKTDVEVDHGTLVSAFLAVYHDRADRILDHNGFVMEPPPRVDVQLYATEAATRLYAEFVISFDCTDVRGEGRREASLELAGNGFYDPATLEFSHFRTSGEKLVFTDETGEQQSSNAVVMVGTASVGHKSVHHTIRYRLE